MEVLKKILKSVIVLIIFLWIAFFGIIIYAVISDYKPGEKTEIPVNGTPSILSDSSEISLLIWNIGYCGLDEDMDFFYDGGTKVRPPKEDFDENFSAVNEFLKSNDTVDFIMLQEVDRKSKRSYRTDEFKSFSENMFKKTSSFATNYDVFFVPVPLSSPMGKVFSGICTFGTPVPSSSVRYSFPGTYGFPKQLFMLDRCFLVNRYQLSDGKELVLINTHNEAFDPGEIRKAQMEYLKAFVTDEFNKGNYIIAGGDWNQTPPDFTPSFEKDPVNTNQMALENDFLPAGWTFAYDNTIPSNRTVTGSYKQGVTATTVIDFFLLSPNVKSLMVKCIDLGFKNSDHNPVIMRAGLGK
jgi:endonuclease/exonuclease/phosphatase family metal-dependent hydrolase